MTTARIGPGTIHWLQIRVGADLSVQGELPTRLLDRSTPTTENMRRRYYVHDLHARKPGVFHEFRPPMGPFPRVGLTDCLKSQIIGRLRAYVEASSWRYMMRRAAHAVIDRIEKMGLRFEMPCAELSEILGLSHSMGGYYLRRLRDVGFLDHYRAHYVDWKATEKLRESVESDDVFLAAPAVHELSPSRWGGIFQSRSDSDDLCSSIAEKRVLSWESVFRKLKAKTQMGLSPILGPPAPAA